MTLLVTALLFSGQQNPVWEAPDSILASSLGVLEDAPALDLRSIGLGWTGFLVRSVENDSSLQKIMLVESGSVYSIKSGKSINSTDLFELLSQELGKRIGVIPNYVGRPRYASMPLVDAVFDPKKWNGDSCVMMHNNCYNYAVDQITNTFAQPGRASGKLRSTCNCIDVGPAAVSDGLVRSQRPAIGRAEDGLVALCSGDLAGGRDFHWYRQDSQGTWSHKPGPLPARNVDQNNQIITDPELAARGPYSDFCGYFNVKNGIVTVI